MTNEQKLIAVVAILPVMADLLEDVKIFRMVKIHGNGTQVGVCCRHLK
jgi:hypothetical protein